MKKKSSGYFRYLCMSFIFFLSSFSPLQLTLSACEFTSPDSTVFQTGVDNEFIIRTASTSTVLLEGELPPGVIFEQYVEPGSAVLRGSPTNESNSIYQLLFTVPSYADCKDNCYSIDKKKYLKCTKKNCGGSREQGCSQVFSLIINPSSPVKDLVITQKASTINAITPLRGKVSFQEIVFDNIIRWKASKTDFRIVAYRIFTDKKLHHLLFEVPSLDKKRFKVRECNVNPCRKHQYFVVAVDEFGNTFKPVKGVRKVIKKNCLIEER